MSVAGHRWQAVRSGSDRNSRFHPRVVVHTETVSSTGAGTGTVAGTGAHIAAAGQPAAGRAVHIVAGSQAGR